MSRAQPPPPRIARYERSVAGGLEDVWENVHDWEHLPWLHNQSFRSIALLSSGDWGWRARVGLSGPDGAEAVIDLRRVPAELAYDVTTLEGPGAGTLIRTRLGALSETTTDVEVSFHVPGVGDDAAKALGQAYVGLYTRLWDQDESMIVSRRAALARPRRPIAREATADLGPRASLELPVRFELAGRGFRLVEVGGALVAHDAACPHRMGPLDEGVLADGCVRCPWHGYRFDVRSGRSADGRGLRLGRAPSIRVDEATGLVTARLAAGP